MAICISASHARQQVGIIRLKQFEAKPHQCTQHMICRFSVRLDLVWSPRQSIATHGLLEAARDPVIDLSIHVSVRVREY